MSEKIELGLFTRLMRLSAGTRTDLLEYIGQAPVLTEDLVRRAEIGGPVPWSYSPDIKAQQKAPA